MRGSGHEREGGRDGRGAKELKMARKRSQGRGAGAEEVKVVAPLSAFRASGFNDGAGRSGTEHGGIGAGLAQLMKGAKVHRLSY